MNAHWSSGSAPAAPLTGALATVPIADVLQLLELGRKSGVLAVDAGDGRRGLVRLADGGLAGARFRDGRTRPPQDTCDVYEAVGALLALPVGRFAFTASAAPPGDTPRVRVEAVLMAALHRADERAHADVVAPVAPEPAKRKRDPGLDERRVPVLVAPPVPSSPAGVTGAARDAEHADAEHADAPPLRAVHWAVLAAVDGVRTEGAVATVSGGDPEAARRALAELVAAGLIAFRAQLAPFHRGDVPPAAARSSAS